MSFKHFTLDRALASGCFLKSFFFQIMVLPPACKNACDCASAFLKLEAAALGVLYENLHNFLQVGRTLLPNEVLGIV